MNPLAMLGKASVLASFGHGLDPDFPSCRIGADSKDRPVHPEAEWRYGTKVPYPW
jgi:hypothetical protein